LRLNRRLAPDVYLDAAPLRISAHGFSIGGDKGLVVDWPVVMRRLDERAMLEHAIAAGQIAVAPLPSDHANTRGCHNDQWRPSVVILVPIARGSGVLDIDQTIAEIRLTMHKLESALIALGKAQQP
jgi:hypothetical protein